MASPQVLKAIAITAQIYGKEFSEDAARIYAGDLGGFPEEAVLTALSRCRKELRTFPAIADILARIDDGRPGPEEAWAMLPKEEESSVVWTEEMRSAFGSVRGLLAEDPIAARMAFREVYTKLLTEARSERRDPRWEPSLGLSKATHAPALLEAARKGRLSQSHVAALLPDMARPERLQISGPEQGLSSFDPSKILQDLRARLAQSQEEV